MNRVYTSKGDDRSSQFSYHDAEKSQKIETPYTRRPESPPGKRSDYAHFKKYDNVRSNNNESEDHKVKFYDPKDRYNERSGDKSREIREPSKQNPQRR